MAINGMFQVVWCLQRGQCPRAVFATFGAVASFKSRDDARRFARAGHPMRRGWYRLVK
jgi:hypothetical protein